MDNCPPLRGVNGARAANQNTQNSDGAPVGSSRQVHVRSLLGANEAAALCNNALQLLGQPIPSYIARSDRAEMREDPAGNWVNWWEVRAQLGRARELIRSAVDRLSDVVVDNQAVLGGSVSGKDIVAATTAVADSIDVARLLELPRYAAPNVDVATRVESQLMNAADVDVLTGTDHSGQWFVWTNAPPALVTELLERSR